MWVMHRDRRPGVRLRLEHSEPFLALAPMEGVSDSIFREMLSELGGIDLCVTEFIRVTGRPVSPSVLLSSCPELRTSGRTSSGVPVVVQLLGSHEPSIAETAKAAVDLGAAGIDLNFGCPAKRVNGHDGGAALLRSPQRIRRIVEVVRSTCPDDVTVSAKIRLGWDNPDDVVVLAQAVEEGGADWIAVHGRTRAALYAPPADWSRIGVARESVSIPIIANGDLFTPDDVARCREVTGCRAFMLGRGVFRNPNLFRWIRGLDPGPWREARLASLLVDFASRVQRDDRFTRPDRVALGRLKQWVRAAGDSHHAMAALFRDLKVTQSIDDAIALLAAVREP